MKQKRLGRQTVVFEAPPRIAAGATIVGDMEGAGPLGGYFDLILEDDTWGEDTWEKAERKMFEQTVRRALERCAMQPAEIDLLLGGDLLNQIITANFAARELAIPFLGLYGACSTMAESLLLGSMLIDGGHKPFQHGRAPVPFPAGDGRPNHTHCAAHGNRRGIKPARRGRLCGRRSIQAYFCDRRHHWQGRGPWDYGCE